MSSPTEPEHKGVWFQLGLSGAFDTALALFDEEREAHYSHWIKQHSDEYRERLKEAESVAKAVFGDVEQLAAPSINSIFEHMQSVRHHAGTGDDEAVSSAVLAALQSHIGHKIVASCCQADGERLFNLLFLMQRCETNGRVKRFLGCVSRCYLFGFDAECIAMSRAALEAQFAAEISRDDCITHLGKRPNYDFSDLVGVAVIIGRISIDLRDKANHVRKDGNDVLHTSPNIPRPAIEVIRDTISIISALGA